MILSSFGIFSKAPVNNPTQPNYGPMLSPHKKICNNLFFIYHRLSIIQVKEKKEQVLNKKEYRA